jgi:hypothetical protein
MTHLGALIWLKWRLFRNSMRSRRGVQNSIASLLGTLAALTVAMLVAVALGASAWFEAASYSRKEAMGPGDGMLAAPPLIFITHAAIFVMWAIVPLSTRGGSQFDPGRMLLYPVSLRKLFAIDLVSELTSLSSIFAVPAMFAMAIGAGLGGGNLWMSLPVALLTTAFGIALAKWLASSLGALMQKRRTRGETLVALLGALLGLGGAVAGQLLPYMTRRVGDLSFRGWRWTPPGAASVALLDGLRQTGTSDYVFALLTLAAYTSLFVAAAYWMARRAALGAGGSAKHTPSQGARAMNEVKPYAGWRLPFLSSELSAVIEKEMRYAMRNAQLRTVAVMPLLLIVMKLAQTGRFSQSDEMPRGMARHAGSFTRYGEGLQAALGALYVFLLLSSLVCNLFAYEGGGMRTLILSPLERRTILIGKNITLTFIALLFAIVLMIVNEIVFRDLTPGAISFAALSFVTFAALFMLVGNWLSVRYPKRLQFGKRMNTSGVSGLLLIPIFATMGTLPAGAAIAGYLAQSLLVKYGTLLLFAGGALSLYCLLITQQGRDLAEREQEILETVVSSQ